MTKQSILIATIGTRDLAFHSSEGEWLSVGNDRSLDDFCQQMKVQYDLGIETGSFRVITQCLYENWETHQKELKPMIIGQLLHDKSDIISKIFLIATDQASTVKYRDKDTIYTAKIIGKYIENNFSNIPVTIISQCTQGENPANFDQMFSWWQNFWNCKEHNFLNNQLLLCLKGGVNQSSEAARITALSIFEDDCTIFDFHEDEFRNKQGYPSQYSEISGSNYLWDKRKKQILILLDRYNYLEAFTLAKKHFDKSHKLYKLIEAGVQWNQGRFEEYFSLAKSYLLPEQKNQTSEYWALAYEQAYTAIVRLKQNNTTEAMLHSFRAIEGLISAWIETEYKNYVVVDAEQIEYSKLKKTICNKLPKLKNIFPNPDQNEIKIDNWTKQRFVELVIESAKNSEDFRAWASRDARKQRNILSHTLGGINEKELFEAWGLNWQNDLDKNLKKWESRIVKCLNLITGQRFQSLTQASLFACTHHQIKTELNNYNLNTAEN